MKWENTDVPGESPVRAILHGARGAGGRTLQGESESVLGKR